MRTFTEAELKEFAMELIERLLPKERILEDFSNNFNLSRAVEWGMEKQEQLDRRVLLRAISDLDEHIEHFKNSQ